MFFGFAQRRRERRGAGAIATSLRLCVSARQIIARGPVSRVLSSPKRGATIPLGRKLPSASSDQPGRRAGTRLMCRPYSVLHPVGFTVPPLLPATRCALAAPFRPYPSEAGRCPFCGTIPEPLSPEGYSSPPGVTRHRCSVEPGLSSLPAFASTAAARSPGRKRYKVKCVAFRVTQLETLPISALGLRPEFWKHPRPSNWRRVPVPT